MQHAVGRRRALGHRGDLVLHLEPPAPYPLHVEAVAAGDALQTRVLAAIRVAALKFADDRARGVRHSGLPSGISNACRRDSSSWGDRGRAIRPSLREFWTVRFLTGQ